jgi:amidophosphoribosyltransferase
MGGMFGTISQNDCVCDLFFGTDYHSHLGAMRGGMAVWRESGFTRHIHDITNTQFRSKFEDDVGKMAGRSGIGVISDYEDQPLLIASHLGPYAIVTVGKIGNSDSLAQEAFGKRTTHFSEMSFGKINPTELVATLINQEATFEDGIRNAQQRIEGSCSLLLLTPGGLYAARDRFGRTPLIIGEKEGARAVASESCSFPNLDFTPVRDLGPGEVVRIAPDGVETLKPPLDVLQVCAFLWIYYGYPASTYESVNAEEARNRCGRALARRDDIRLDFVAGIPDSGTAHAIGYAAEAGVPYKRPFVKYTPTWPRSFMPRDQRVRDLIARMKLIPVRELIRNRNIMFCEDSIVRGTQLQDIIRRLYDYGAGEIHMRAACPPLVYACPYLNFSRTRSEMELACRSAIAALEEAPPESLEEYTRPDSEKYARMIEIVRRRLKLTSLRYQRIDDMIEAIGLPREKLCTACWTGRKTPGA